MASHSKQETDDEILGGLTQTQFDPVQFLNDTLPTLTLSSQPSTAKQQRTAMLQSTSTELQAILSKLSAHSVRSSAELTSLTDEILRNGNRLAYEVEVLRGDVNGLYELLTDSLKEDIVRFVVQETNQENSEMADVTVSNANLDPASGEPEFIRQLHLLGTVKSRLEGVVASFGEALKWPIPPSEVSMASSLISVSAPELGIANSAEDDKAREYTRKLRNEVTEALESERGGYTGLEIATKKVNNLRAISQIWKGTAEEKARTRVVEGLSKLVEDRKKLLDARSAPTRTSTEGSGPRSSSMPGRSNRIVEGSTTAAAGLFRNLTKFRDEMYLD